jgi:plasmid segregation protein ParM
MSVCTSLHGGVNLLFKQINEVERAKGKKNIPDATIEGILLNDKSVLVDCSPERVNLVRANAKQFAQDLILQVSQAGLDLIENQTVFVGGGSILLKEYIETSDFVSRFLFVDNVFANAQGYLLLYENRKIAGAQGASR